MESKKLTPVKWVNADNEKPGDTREVFIRYDGFMGIGVCSLQDDDIWWIRSEVENPTLEGAWIKLVPQPKQVEWLKENPNDEPESYPHPQQGRTAEEVLSKHGIRSIYNDVRAKQIAALEEYTTTQLGEEKKEIERLKAENTAMKDAMAEVFQIAMTIPAGKKAMERIQSQSSTGT